MPTTGRAVTAPNSDRGPRPGISAYAPVGTLTVQTNRTNQESSSASPMTESPRFIVIQRGSQQPLYGSCNSQWLLTRLPFAGLSAAANNSDATAARRCSRRPEHSHRFPDQFIYMAEPGRQ